MTHAFGYIHENARDRIAGVAASLYFQCSESGGVKRQVSANSVGLGFDLGIGSTFGGALRVFTYPPYAERRMGHPSWLHYRQ
jgi:hypothetical protein